MSLGTLPQNTEGDSAALAARAAAAKPAEYFGPAGEAKDIIAFAPETLDEKNRTVDAVWYGGMTVPRTNYDTGEDYMLRLNMAGCRMERLNAGAPVFDCHMSGLDFRSIVANQAGARAQRGSVVKAWAEAPKGLATLQFGVEGENEDTDRLWSGIASGRVRNLSFGTWIYSKQPVKDANGNGITMPHPNGTMAPVFEATDWEPFEISAVTVPADFSTTFLSADGGPDGSRATGPNKEKPVGTQAQVPGDQARANEVALSTARAETLRQERERVAGISALGKTHKLDALAEKLVADGVALADAQTRFSQATDIQRRGAKFESQLPKNFVAEFIASGKSPEEFGNAVLEHLSATGRQVEIRGEAAVTRDEGQTMAQGMEAALLLRANPKFFLARYPQNYHEVELRGKFLPGCGDAEQRNAVEMARPNVGYRLHELGREFLSSRGIRVRGLNVVQLATRLFEERFARSGAEIFDAGGGQSSSDFPAILANVANKTLRQAYEAYPQTFRPISKPATASDFKPVNRTQLSDLAALLPVNEDGEFHRSALSDGKISYALGTFGEIVALTRKTIINDDLQAFTRVPATLGQAASTTQSDKVWACITGNPSATYMGDAAPTNLFAAGHSNLQTTSTSAFGVAALASGRAAMRQQLGPKGTHLNVEARYLVVPTVLETAAQQVTAPINLTALTALTEGVTEWMRSLIVIVEPRLDSMATYGTTAWYLVADPAMIDTIEYCFLEGQEGVYFETRQGFEVDGMEMKARMDFAAAAIEYRGLQRSNGKA